MRLNSLEGNISHSVAQLHGEDALIAGALEDGMARVSEFEKGLTANIERIQQIEKRQFAAQEDAVNGAARIAVLEESLNAVSQSLVSKNIALENQANDVIAHISSMETNLNARIQKLQDQVSSTTASIDRIATLEERAESLRVGFNQKMGEICDYVTAQVESVGRQQAQPQRQAPARTTPVAVTQAAPTRAAAQPAPTRAVAAPVAPAMRSAATMFTPPVTTTPAPQNSNELPSFPKFPNFPTPPSHDSPQQHPQSNYRA